MSNILEEYLVGLKFRPDEVSYRKFEDLLKRASGAVEHQTTGMLSTLVKVQTGIFTAFTGVSTGILGLVDSIAQADQGYRLLGMRQMMTTDSARKLDMVTKALGVSLEDMIWDPELHARALSMFQDIEHWTKQLGPDFEKNMIGIRDIRMQFSRLKLELQFLGMGFASDLFTKLGIDGAKITKWVDDLGEKLPQIANELADDAVPVLKETWIMLQAMGGAAKQFGVLFANIVGLLSGDDSLEGTTLSLHQMGQAFQHVMHWGAEFFQLVTLLEKALGHFATSIADVFEGKFKQAGQELLQGFGDIGGVLMTGMGGAAGGGAIGGFLGSMVLPGVGTWAGAALGAKLGSYLGSQAEQKYGGMLGGNEDLAPLFATQKLAPLVAAKAEQYHIPPALALAIARQESGFNQAARSKAGAVGVMQLIPDTARTLGVNPNDATQNIEGGTKYLSQLLARYGGNEALAAAAYNAGPGKVDQALKRYGLDFLAHLPKETQDYVPRVLRMEHQYDLGRENARSLAYMQQPPEVAQPSVSNNQRVTVDVGGVYIQHQNPNTSDITKGVAAGIRKGLQSQTQFDLGQLQAAY